MRTGFLTSSIRPPSVPHSSQDKSDGERLHVRGTVEGRAEDANSPMRLLYMKITINLD